MKVIEKRHGGHNLPRLEGISSSQSITNDFDEGRSTNIATNDLQSSNNVNQHINHPLPLTPRSSASVNTPTSVFFPPLPPRLSKIRSNVLSDTNHLSKTDFNMNNEHERNREKSANDSTSPTASTRLIGIALNSPSIQSRAINASFFPESQHSFGHKQSPQTTANLLNHPQTPTSAAGNCGPSDTVNMSDRWPQQQQTDDNYHLYHEPIDMDEQLDLPNPSGLANKTQHGPISTADSLNLAPVPPRPRPNSSMAIRVSHDTSDTLMATSGQVDLNPDEILHRRVSSSFAHRVGLPRDDVSADIYFRYVTVKPNERSNYKSRSYHGPKNTNNNATQNCHPFVREAPTNSTTTSAGDLPISPSFVKSPDTPMLFRDHCVKELIETELNYVHALEMIISKFAKPMEVLLKRDDNLLIFGHIKEFYYIHKKFQANLVKATCGSNNLSRSHAFMRNQSLSQTSSPSTPTLTSPHLLNFPRSSPLASPTETDLLVSPKVSKDNHESPLKISSCFMKVKTKFLKYGEYCATLAKVQSLLDDLTNKNEAIASQLDRCQQEANEGRFKLRDLLSLPMQRILKYHLLLAQIIKNTESENDDYQGLKRAYESMVDLCEYINEVSRDTEAIQIISCIESSIVGLNMPPNTKLTDYGRLVIDDLIRIKTPQDNKQKVNHDTRLKIPLKSKPKMYVFVFDKVMLITVRTRINGSIRYEYKEALVLSEYELELNSDSQPSETLGKWSFHFNLVKASDRTTYTFYVKTQEMKTKWTSSIRKAMENTRPLPCRKSDNNHEFLMHTFEKASSCDHCGKLLHGLFYQGYRCRICFISVHKKCLDNVKLCGPALPPKLISSAFNRRGQCNEPPSPSIRSNCSVENGFSHQASPNQCEDALPRNEYSNIVRGSEQSNHLLASLREHNSRGSSSRPVASMINVSSQNSSSTHLLRQRRLLSSASTPAISRRTCLRARAIADFDGNKEADELEIKSGDLILIDRDIIKPTTPQDELDNAFSQLALGSTDPEQIWWSGKNTRTNDEGRFPSNVVEVINDLGDGDYIRRDDDNMRIDKNVNFILYDLPWFCGRMERERAQVLLEGKPHETFLVRVSLKHNGSYVISLKFNSQVKHMRIYVSQDGTQFYLSQNRHFRSIIELVNWYGENSLVESFHMLDARLSIPFKAT